MVRQYENVSKLVLSNLFEEQGWQAKTSVLVRLRSFVCAQKRPPIMSMPLHSFFLMYTPEPSAFLKTVCLLP
jgi:hypothetical protein